MISQKVDFCGHLDAICLELSLPLLFSKRHKARNAGKSRQCRKNRFPWNGRTHLGDSGNGGRTLEFLSLSCGERFLLRCDGNPGNSFPNTQGKDPSSQARRRKGDSSGCGQDSRASSRVETGMWGNFLSCSKGVKDSLEIPELKCD